MFLKFLIFFLFISLKKSLLKLNLKTKEIIVRNLNINMNKKSKNKVCYLNVCVLCSKIINK